MAMLLGASTVEASAFASSVDVVVNGLTQGRGLVALVSIKQAGGDAITSITTTNNGSFTLIGSLQNGTGFVAGFAIQMAYLSSMPTGGNETITVNTNIVNSPDIVCTVAEVYFSGNLGILLDGSGTGANSTANPSVTVTTGSNNSGLIGVVQTTDGSSAGNPSDYAGSGYTYLTSNRDMFDNPSEYKLDAGAAGAQSVTWVTTATEWFACAAGFKQASVANAGIVTGLGSSSLTGVQGVVGMGLIPGSMIAGT